MSVIDDIVVEDWNDHLAVARRRLRELKANPGDTVVVRDTTGGVAHVTKSPLTGPDRVEVTIVSSPGSSEDRTPRPRAQLTGVSGVLLEYDAPVAARALYRQSLVEDFS